MKKHQQCTKIDLGHDGAHQLSVEYSDPYDLGNGAWWFCRDGKQMRRVDAGYLEGHLIDKILELTKKSA